MKGAAASWIMSQPWSITREVWDVMLEIADRENDPIEAVEAKLGRPLDNSHSVSMRDGVAIVPVIGPIARRADLFTRISGATSIDTLARDFQQALDDRSVKAIILEIESPGGTVAGVSEFAAQVRSARGVKPIVAYVGSQGASAAYWIASAADRIVADSTAMLGSIGVIIGVPPKKAGDPRKIVSSQSPRKQSDPDTQAGMDQLQTTADDLADLFVDAVADNRGVSRETVLSDFGQGGSFVASKAVAAGMADSVGSLEGVIACLARGEMPCPSKPKPKPAPKADHQPRRPAMSEQQNPPVVAGETVTLSASEIAELRRQAAEGQNARAEAKASRDEAIAARADAFVSEFVGAASKTQYALGLRGTFVLAASDDHDHPIGGSKTHRQDKLRETMKARPAPTKEASSGDLTGKTRALAADPADEDEHDPKKKADADLASVDATARKVGAELNGRK